LGSWSGRSGEEPFVVKALNGDHALNRPGEKAKDAALGTNFEPKTTWMAYYSTASAEMYFQE